MYVKLYDVRQKALQIFRFFHSPYIRGLLPDKRKIDGLTLKKINQHFFRSPLLLSGDTVSIHDDSNSGNVVGVNRGPVSWDCISAVQGRILESEELSAEEKVKMLKVLRG